MPFRYRLESILKKHNLFMDFKIHPIFKHYLQYFDNNNSRVRFQPKSLNDAAYVMFITDFSSYVFDFGFLNRSIMYFVPDAIE